MRASHSLPIFSQHWTGQIVSRWIKITHGTWLLSTIGYELLTNPYRVMSSWYASTVESPWFTVVYRLQWCMSSLWIEIRRGKKKNTWKNTNQYAAVSMQHVAFQKDFVSLTFPIMMGRPRGPLPPVEDKRSACCIAAVQFIPRLWKWSPFFSWSQELLLLVYRPGGKYQAAKTTRIRTTNLFSRWGGGGGDEQQQASWYESTGP